MATNVCAAKIQGDGWADAGSKSSMRSAFGIVLLLLFFARVSGAYTVVTSTDTPPTLEKAMIAQTTTQFSANLFVNPLVPNTYQIKLFGPNPTYNPDPSAADIYNSSLQFEYASGMMYERNKDTGASGYYMGLCDSATNFVVNPTTDTLAAWNPETCTDALGFFDNWIVSQTSGVAVLPNPLVGL